MALAVRRLPGVVIEVVPPPPAEALPRMDVAVMVGFAATGPMHIAVPVESVAQYAAVFGPDASLAWNAEQGVSISSYLGPAVRAFFSNGGRRCWVIRVGRTAELEDARWRVTGTVRTTGIATANVFAVPGVLSVSTDATPRATAAIARARCEGSWSDELRVATALSRRRFSIEQVEAGGSPGAATLRFATRFPLRPGDLVELSDPTASDTRTFAKVEAVQVAPEPGGASWAVATVCGVFEVVKSSSSPSSPDEWPGTAEVYGFGGEVPATLTSSAVGEAVRFDAPVPDALERGHWVRWTDGVTRVWLRIDDVARVPAFGGSPTASNGGWVTSTVSGPAWRELSPTAISGGFDRADLLTIDFRVTGGETAVTASVSPTPEGVDSWWARVSDADMYAPSRDGTQRVVPSTEPRFPLCRADEPLPSAWIPLGVSSLFDEVVGPLPQPGSSLERDGLAEFGAELFLDPELANAPARSIVELADAIRFLRADSEVRSLFGIHAGLSVGAGGLFNEASLLAIPDAIHLGWYSRGDDFEASVVLPPSSPVERTHRGPCGPDDDAVVGPPDLGVFLECGARELGVAVLHGPSEPVPPGTFRLTWSDVEPEGEYVLLESTRPDLSDEHEVARTPDAEHVVLAQREGVYHYRVFARVGTQRGDWSNVVTVLVRKEAWLSHTPEEADALMEGEWLAVHRAALRMAMATGEWFAVLAMPAHFRTPHALRYAQRLRAVREPLEVNDDTFDFTERRALSYGALYYPWLGADARRTKAGQGKARADERGGTTVGFAPSAQPTVVPPDGAALGVLAARASRRGAWVAAANEPLRDVVALTPTVATGDWQALQDAQVNVVRDDPRGFLTLSADTLSHEEELRPINVRRLLTLLRRLALRRGTSYVFEPNGPTLRRAVQRGFETILTDLFRRGAFAGATPATSFQVVTEGVRSVADEEAGRFVVELRVAPSSPLSFLAVRLDQTGARLSITEEL